MCLCTKYGFFSIVEKSLDKFHVRARVRNDLENLREAFAANTPGRLPAIRTWIKADYRYRIVTDVQHVRAVFALLHDMRSWTSSRAQRTSLENCARIPLLGRVVERRSG